MNILVLIINILVLILLVVLIFGPGILQYRSFRQFFWATVHNEIAHPWLRFQTSWTSRFHAWSAAKMEGM